MVERSNWSLVAPDKPGAQDVIACFSFDAAMVDDMTDFGVAAPTFSRWSEFTAIHLAGPATVVAPGSDPMKLGVEGALDALAEVRLSSHRD